jgi:pimeloyl-ACP methyl ester carboxylesterase
MRDDAAAEHGSLTAIDVGAGPTVLALHGLLGSMDDWGDLAGAFSRACRVVVPALPVHDLPRERANISVILGLLEEFIVERRLTMPLHLVGSSLGGQIALMYAAKHPSNVASLALTGSSGLREHSATGRLLSTLLGVMAPRRNDYELFRTAAETIVYDPAAATREWVDAAFAIINDDVRLGSTIAVAKSGFRLKLLDEMAALHLPVCLIWGRDDTVTPPDVAEEFHQRLINSDLFWIDRCGHAPMREHPAEFNGLLWHWYEARGLIRRAAASSA